MEAAWLRMSKMRGQIGLALLHCAASDRLRVPEEGHCNLSWLLLLLRGSSHREQVIIMAHSY